MIWKPYALLLSSALPGGIEDRVWAMIEALDDSQVGDGVAIARGMVARR